MEPVGLLGFGVMGSAAGEKILKSGLPLVIFDPTDTARNKAKSLGASLETTPAGLARICRSVFMFLPGPDQVRECVAGKNGLLQSASNGLVIVDHSTIDPETTRAMSALASEKKVGYLDAPVLGRPAAVGNWALPVGGEQQSLEQCRPILETYAKIIIPVGESGTGNQIKLLNQLMFSAINAMTAEMMAVADKMGIAPKLLYKTITASQAGTVSNLFKELGARIAEDNYKNPTFSIDLLIKDVRLSLEMARRAGAQPLLGHAVEFINGVAKSQGLGDEDTAAMWKSMRKLFG